MEDATITRWLLALIVALAVVLLVAYARHDAGVDGRAPDPEDVNISVSPAD